MACTQPALEGGTYCDNLEQESGGLKDYMAIWQHGDVQTYPTYTSTPGTGGAAPSVSEASILCSTGFTMKSGKKPLKYPLILEKSGLTVTSDGNIFNTELKVRMQDNSHNRGLATNLIKARFSCAFAEDNGQVRLIGQSDGITTAYLATVKKGSYKENIDDALTGEKYIELVITARRYQPTDYNTTITF